MEHRNVLIICIIVFIFLVAAAAMSDNFVLSSNLIFIGIFVLLGPYSIIKFFEFKKIKAYEEQFPIFLRDLAESQRAGLTLMQSIQAAAKSEYGPLTSEIRKIDNQLSWNIPVENVLRSFAERMKKSKTIVRALIIIEQATKSGGNIEATMEALASNIEALKDVQEEKSVALNQQVMMMYAIFFVFLGITISLIKFLIPLLQTQVETGGFGFQGFSTNPCEPCVNNPDPICLGCHTFFGVSRAMNFSQNQDAASYYKGLFFTMIIVQAIFTGLIAGQIGSDSLIGGLKHSFIMVMSGIMIFLISIRIGFI